MSAVCYILRELVANEILHENAVEYAKVAVESRCTQQQFLASLPPPPPPPPFKPALG